MSKLRWVGRDSETTQTKIADPAHGSVHGARASTDRRDHSLVPSMGRCARAGSSLLPIEYAGADAQDRRLPFPGSRSPRGEAPHRRTSPTSPGFVAVLACTLGEWPATVLRSGSKEAFDAVESGSARPPAGGEGFSGRISLQPSSRRKAEPPSDVAAGLHSTAWF